MMVGVQGMVMGDGGRVKNSGRQVKNDRWLVILMKDGGRWVEAEG